MRKPSPPTVPPPPAAPPSEAPPGGPGSRRRRSDGARSHHEILRAAADLASVEGLEGLTIASLAKHVGLSKSGLFAHFRSKEDLQLQTIDLATEIFQEEVVRPALERPEGVARIRALVEDFAGHVRGRTFPGGCFFASVSAEVDGHPGKLRDRIAAIHRGWIGLFERSVVEAQERGELDRDADAPQVAFELVAMLAGAHSLFLLQGDDRAFDRAFRGTEAVLAANAGRRRAAASR